MKPHVGGLKVGLEFITALGPEGIGRIVELGLPVFADTKFHDIPNTVAGAARAIGETGIDIFNVHASGGAAMMRAARGGRRRSSIPRPKVIAVTVLTSLTMPISRLVGQSAPAAGQVDAPGQAGQGLRPRWRRLQPAGIALVREACGAGFSDRDPGRAPGGRRPGRPAPGHDAGRSA